jgi:glycosyltransferase involved in cell wall biosynthesis
MKKSDEDGKIIFISTMGLVPWGGSEELWSRTALDLVTRGFPVAASVLDWSPVHARVRDLQARGVEVCTRPRWYSIRRHPLRWLAMRDRDPVIGSLEQIAGGKRPGLVVISEGGSLTSIDLLEYCADRKLPFVTISQANSVGTWYNDDHAARYRAALPQALRCFFVSRENLAHAEKQIGAPIFNGEVVWNPVNVRSDFLPPWPDDAQVRFASVARLHPPSKGQDVLLEAFAGASWRERRWELRLYGEGPMKDILQRLAHRFGLADRVVFAGVADVEKIWTENHVLVMPSRYEGLPLAMVEAMLCARPVIATDVAGHAEIIADGITGFLAGPPTPATVASALERFWERRDDAENIGRAGARRIRELLPANPVQAFSVRLQELAGLRTSSST